MPRRRLPHLEILREASEQARLKGMYREETPEWCIQWELEPLLAKRGNPSLPHPEGVVDAIMDDLLLRSPLFPLSLRPLISELVKSHKHLFELVPRDFENKTYEQLALEVYPVLCAQVDFVHNKAVVLSTLRQSLVEIFSLEKAITAPSSPTGKPTLRRPFFRNAFLKFSEPSYLHLFEDVSLRIHINLRRAGFPPSDLREKPSLAPLAPNDDHIPEEDLLDIYFKDTLLHPFFRAASSAKVEAVRQEILSRDPCYMDIPKGDPVREKNLLAMRQKYLDDPALVDLLHSSLDRIFELITPPDVGPSPFTITYQPKLPRTVVREIVLTVLRAASKGVLLQLRIDMQKSLAGRDVLLREPLEDKSIPDDEITEAFLGQTPLWKLLE